MISSMLKVETREGSSWAHSELFTLYFSIKASKYSPFCTLRDLIVRLNNKQKVFGVHFWTMHPDYVKFMQKHISSLAIDIVFAPYITLHTLMLSGSYPNIFAVQFMWSLFKPWNQAMILFLSNLFKDIQKHPALY